MSLTGGKIIQQLITKNGPMTTNKLATFIPQYKQELVSKSHMKKHILTTLENQRILAKRIARQEDAKAEWRWHFVEELKASDEAAKKVKL